MKNFYFSPRLSLLAILVLFLFAPVSAQYFYHAGIVYKMTDENTAEVSYLDGDFSGVVEIPGVINAIIEPMYSEPYEATVTITGIGNYAFEYCSNITEVVLPNTISYISDAAFYHCNSLSKVNLPNSLTSISRNAFSYTGLKAIEIPESVTELGWNVFYGCEQLTDVTLPNSITDLPGTFAWCTALEHINIPNSVTSLYDTFHGCTKLNNVVIPGSVTAIGQSTFYQCNTLNDITCLAIVPPTLSNSNSFYSELFDIYATAMLRVPESSIGAYKAAPVWKLFVNINGTTNTVRGDINGDDEVNIGDINAIINLILKGEYNDVADLNGDGEVNIADVNAVIGIILRS